jgi:hypothetical protein
MQKLDEIMRRVVTADDADGRSTIIVDGGPSARAGDLDLGGLFEIWEDSTRTPLDPRDKQDLGAAAAKLGPRAGNFQVRWFVISPIPPGIPREQLDAIARQRFAAFGAADHVVDQTRHPAMHETHTIDVVCVLQGKVKLILEASETVLQPGQVVIQRGTNHAWEAVDGPALLLAVLIDRPITTS